MTKNEKRRQSRPRRALAVESRKGAQGRDADSAQWVRLPKAGEKLRGLTRSYLSSLCAEGSVRSILIVKPGAKRGIRLISVPSLEEFFASVERRQRTGEAGQSPRSGHQTKGGAR